MPRLKRALVGVLAAAVLAVTALIAAPATSHAGGWCRWQWGIQYTYYVFGTPINKWGPVYVCGYTGPGR